MMDMYKSIRANVCPARAGVKGNRLEPMWMLDCMPRASGG